MSSIQYPGDLYRSSSPERVNQYSFLICICISRHYLDIRCLHQVILTTFIRLTRDRRWVSTDATSHPSRRWTLSVFEESIFRTVTKQRTITLPETATCMALNLNCAIPSMERPHRPIALVIPPVTPDLFLFLTRA